MNTASTRMLARRYAQAFVHSYGHELTQEVRGRIGQLRQFLAANNRILFFLIIPTIDSTVKEQGLIFLCQKFELPDCVKKSVMLLFTEGRISLLAQFLALVDLVYQDYYAISSFTIKSSHALSPDQREFLRQFLKKHTGHDIVYTCEIDKKLIAGIRMYSLTHMWEHSISRQLRSVQQLLVR